MKGVDVIRILSGVTKPLRAYVESSRVIRVLSGVSFLFVVQEGRGRHSGFLLVGLLSPYGLMWNLAVFVFIGCFCFVGS